MSPEDFDSFTVTAFDAKIYRIAIDSLLTLFWTWSGWSVQCHGVYGDAQGNLTKADFEVQLTGFQRSVLSCFLLVRFSVFGMQSEIFRNGWKRLSITRCSNVRCSCDLSVLPFSSRWIEMRALTCTWFRGQCAFNWNVLCNAKLPNNNFFVKWVVKRKLQPCSCPWSSCTWTYCLAPNQAEIPKIQPHRDRQIPRQRLTRRNNNSKGGSDHSLNLKEYYKEGNLRSFMKPGLRFDSRANSVRILLYVDTDQKGVKT